MQRVNRHQDAYFLHGWLDGVHGDELQAKLLDMSRQPFDLKHDAMMRVYCFSRTPDDHILLIVRHHIMNDRTTGALATEELFKLYHAKQTNSSIPPVTTPSYFEFLQWHNQYLNSSEGKQQQAYWEVS